MKKLILLAAALFFVGCSRAEAPTSDSGVVGGGTIEQPADPQGEVVGTISDFFPFEENVMFTIAPVDSIEGITATDQQIFTTIINGDRIQQRIMAPNIDNTVVLDRSGGTLTQEFIFQDFYLFEDVTMSPSNMHLVILQEPLMIGHSWSNEFEEHPGTATITDVNVEITTPAGTFTDAIEVTTEFENGDTAVTHFAKGHGQIRDTYSTAMVDLEGNATPISITTELTKVSRGPLVGNMYVFGPDDQIMTLETTGVEIEVNTNQNFETLFADVLSNTLIEQMSINKITIDRELSLSHVDFSNPFELVNFGVSYEELFLNALANTFGNFFYTENFRITINGQNYSSGHFTFADGEYIHIG